MKRKRVMVDMSATLLHHGHIRLLRKASQKGSVFVALTTDDEILRVKGYRPELNFSARKEILEAIKFVDRVIPAPWHINEQFLDLHAIDLLVHGHDNCNMVPSDRLVIYARTAGISSSILRQRVLLTAGASKAGLK
jgi:glycerol-3-phosphate cytidylyltransferase